MNTISPEKLQLTCQHCNMQYVTIKRFKAHVRCLNHKQEVAKLFKQAVHQGPVFFPIFFVLDYLRKPKQSNPVIGLDMVTLCITPERCGAVYLCHICEENLCSSDIVSHLCSADHYFKYLAFCNPELLRFAWLNDSFSYLQSSAWKEKEANGSGSLRIFELPKQMLKCCKKQTYHQVMKLFSKTDKMTERLKAGRPWGKSLQAYIRDPARTNPLLGTDVLLEYSCPDSVQHCGYLCILCKKKVSASGCISHCISFSHIYWYMEAAHPGTLDCPKSSYTHYSFKFHEKILYLANQAQKDHPPGEIQSIHLDLPHFMDISTSSFANALHKLQQIRRERNQSEIKVSVARGQRIPPASEFCESSSTATTNISAGQEVEKMHKGDSTTPKTPSEDRSYKILCVECDQKFSFISQYKEHIKGNGHKQKLFGLFGQGIYSGSISKINLYKFMMSRHRKSPPLVVGLHLLTVLVDRQSPCSNPPLYLCHACQISISVTSVMAHFTAKEHCINVLTYTKPDLVLLDSGNVAQITEQLQEEEMKMVLQVCEVPSELCMMFRRVGYEKIMATIRNHELQLSKCIEVQKRVTLESYAKNCDRKAPLLGLHLMVKYSTTQPYPKCGYLCLLCKTKLSEIQSIAHVLSFTHVCAYLKEAHPGSLTEDCSDQKSLIVDLAQQAEHISRENALQVMELEFPKFHEVESTSFDNAVDVLQLFLKEKGYKELKTSVVPGAKLVSSFQKHYQKNIEGEKQESRPVPSNTEQVNLDVICTETPLLKMDDKPTTVSLELTIKQPSEPLKPIKSLGSASAHVVHPAETITTKQNTPLSHTVQTELLGMDTQPISEGASDNLPLMQTTEYSPIVNHNQDHSQHQSKDLKDLADEKTKDDQKLGQSPASLINETQAVSTMSAPEYSDLGTYLKTTNREPVIGLDSVFECHTDEQPPFYVCMVCIARLQETFIIRHLTSHEHQRMYLKHIGCLSLEGKSSLNTTLLRTQSLQVERSQGHGEAQALELKPEDYSLIMNCPIETALGKLKEILIKLAEVTDQSAMADSSVVDSKFDACHNPKAHEKINKPEYKDSTYSNLKGTADMAGTTSSEDPAWSSPFLWSYLSSSTRTEPVIGLSMITEFRRSSGQNSFLCSCCNVIKLTSKYMAHLISPRHRFNYIKNKHPELVATWRDASCLTSKIPKLKVMAQMLQDREGWGCLKVVEKELPKKRVEAAKRSEKSAKVKKVESSPNNEETGSTEDQVQNRKRHNSTEHQQRKKKKRDKGNPMIGLNFVTCVSHGNKKLFFCSLCSVRCQSDHMSSVSHRKAYVERKYEWTPSEVKMEKKLHKIALRLAAVERSTGIGMKKLKVSASMFTTLRTAPFNEALSQLAKLKTKVGQLHNNTHLCQAQGNSGGDGEDNVVHSAAENNPLQHEPAPHLERSVITDEVRVPQNADLSTDLPTSCDQASPCTSESLHTLAQPYSPISPPLECQTSSPLPQLSSTSNLFSFFSQPLVTSLPPPAPSPAIPSVSLSTHCTTAAQPPWVSDLNQTALAVSPSDVFKPLFSPREPPLSLTLPVVPLPSSSPCSQISSLSTSFLQPSRNPHLEIEQRPADAYIQCVQREESRHQVTPPPNTYSLLNIPSTTGQSYASVFLSVRGLSSTEPIVGLSNILEFQRISQPTFFLCLNCAEKISRDEICNHVTSERHQYCSIKSQYPEIFHQWHTNPSLKVRDVAKTLAVLEKGADAKVVKLNQKQYDCLSSADYYSAIEILQVMYGPEQNQPTLPSYQNQRNIARSLHDRVESARETHTPQSRLSCDLTPTQTTPHKTQNNQLSSQALHSTNDNFDGNTSDQVQHTPSTEASWLKTSNQTLQTQQLSKQQTSLTTESAMENTPNTHTESMQEKPKEDCTSSLPSSNSNIICCVTTIKQEKPDDEVSQGTCCFNLEHPSKLPTATSGEATGNLSKNKNAVMEYVKSKRALEDAVVGLSLLIECQSEGKAPLYLCVSCSIKVSHDLIVHHLLKCGHRYMYLSVRYPWLFEDWSDSEEISLRSQKLMLFAHKVETTYEDEPGQPQEMKLEYADLKEIQNMPFDKAIKNLQKIRKEQNRCALQTSISPKIPPAVVKQEKIETQVMISHSPQLAYSSETIPHRSDEADTCQTDVPDSPLQSPIPVKRLKLSSALDSSHVMTGWPNNRGGCDNKISSVLMSSKDSLSHNHAHMQQKSSHSYAESSHKFSSSSVTTTNPNNKYSGTIQKTSSANKPAEDTEQNKSMAKRNPVDPRLTARRPLDFHCDRLALNRLSSQTKSSHGLSNITPTDKSTTQYTPKIVMNSPNPKNTDKHSHKKDCTAKWPMTNQECTSPAKNGTNSSKENPITSKSCRNPVTTTDEERYMHCSVKSNDLRSTANRGSVVQFTSHDTLHQQSSAHLKKSNPNKATHIPLKRPHPEIQVPALLTSRKKSTGHTSSQLKRTVSSQDNRSPSKPPMKRGKSLDTGSDFSEIKKVPSILSTVRSGRPEASHYLPSQPSQSNLFSLDISSAPQMVSKTNKDPRESDPSSQSHINNSSHQPLSKTVNKVPGHYTLETPSSSFLALQQQDPYPNMSVGVPSVEVHGQEITRLLEKRPPAKMRSCENAWNYENRQFTTETLNTNTRDVDLRPTSLSHNVATSGQHTSLSMQSYTEKPNLHPLQKTSANNSDVSAYVCADNGFDPSGTAKNYPTVISYPAIPTANANLCLSVPQYSTAAQVTCPGMHEYALSYQCSGFTQPDLSESCVSSTTTVPNYPVPVDERPQNVETAASGDSVMMAYASQPVYPFQQTYLPLQSYHTLGGWQAYYAVSAYNQPLSLNQTSVVSESVTPIASTHGCQEMSNSFTTG